ncbi:hypothetical protein FRB97_007371 [Tulasnella sp. 331]|nr:hypothetical protein FRB97_007371 [Tulasnella sp. 331]KAG8888493.1 hypothetical protein FRB98_007533 [Tulasnella sp. 332]
MSTRKTALKWSGEPSTSATKIGSAKRPRAPPKLDYLLSDPKSKLCYMEITEVINANTWSMLSEDARNRLSALLPPTSFWNFMSEVDPSHPSRSSKVNRSAEDRMEVDYLPRSAAFLKDDFMSCQFLHAATNQFQDHIFSSYFTEEHHKKVEAFQQALKDGSAHVPWKDDAWAQDHGEDDVSQPTTAVQGSSKRNVMTANNDRCDYPPSLSICELNTLVATLSPYSVLFPSLRELAAHEYLRVGDVISYNRAFGKLRHSVTVKKDLLVQSIDPDSLSVTFLLAPSSLTSLGDDIVTFPSMILPTIPTTNLTPVGLRVPGSNNSQAQILHPNNAFDPFDTSDLIETNYASTDPEFLSITASTSSLALESHILPLFDAVPPHDVLTEAECLKCFTIWRWNQGEDDFGGNPDLPHGGRKIVGTLHYLALNCP